MPPEGANSITVMPKRNYAGHLPVLPAGVLTQPVRYTSPSTTLVAAENWTEDDQNLIQAEETELANQLAVGTVATSSSSSCVEPPESVGVRSSNAEVRKDAPCVKHTVRGSKTAALEAASSNTQRIEALGDFEQDAYARSSLGPRATLLNTYVLFHDQWFGEQVPAFPLTPNKIACVAAMFKQGRYRSYANYLDRAKDRHIELRSPWTDELQRARKIAVRSVTRGIGPSRQTADLDVEQVSKLAGVEGTKNKPLNSKGLFVIGSFFGVRELESSSAEYGHLTLVTLTLLFSWRPPVSKTDVKALGATRTW